MGAFFYDIVLPVAEDQLLSVIPLDGIRDGRRLRFFGDLTQKELFLLNGEHITGPYRSGTKAAPEITWMDALLGVRAELAVVDRRPSCRRLTLPQGTGFVHLPDGRQMGVDYVLDTSFSADLTILEESAELLRRLQKDERLSTQQKAQRAREIAKKESEKLFIGTEVVHNPVKEFVPLKEVKVGQEVCIAELNQLATVLALPDKNGDVLVRAGIIKTKVPLKGLKQPDKLIKEPQPKTKAQQRYSRLTGDANRPNGRVERVQRSAKMELNLLGLTVDEALPEVDAYIDRAILNGQTVVYLIHGNGTGALRTAIHKHLRGNRMVKSFRLGRYGEGESGVTVVELK